MTKKITNSDSVYFEKPTKKSGKTIEGKVNKLTRSSLEKNQTTPISNENKRKLDDDFTSSFNTAIANSRIAQINFPHSPKKKNPPIFEDTRPLFEAPKYVGSLFAGQVEDKPFVDFSEYIPSEPLITNSLKPAQTPRKPPVNKTRAGAVISIFQKLYDALSTHTFKYTVAYLAKGSYFNVYTLEDNVKPIIPDVSNADLVLKAFHGENSGFGEAKLRCFLRNAIKNYNDAIAAGLPVAHIYNADTAVQDGYIIQQKISEKVDPLNAQHMLQVQNYFEVSLKEGLVMDLLPQNFACKDGQVILFDFVEDPEDGIQIFHKHAIEKWLKLYRTVCLKKDQAAEFLNKLSANHYQAFVQEQLELFEWD